MTDTENDIALATGLDTDVDLDDDGEIDLVQLFSPSLVDKLTGSRKALIAGVGALAQGGAMAGLDGTVLPWSQTSLAVLTAAAVYLVRNVKPEPLWLAADEPAATGRAESDEPIGATEPPYLPEHAEDDASREHRPEHAAPDRG